MSAMIELGTIVAVRTGLTVKHIKYYYYEPSMSHLLGKSLLPLLPFVPILC